MAIAVKEIETRQEAGITITLQTSQEFEALPLEERKQLVCNACFDAIQKLLDESFPQEDN
jgi:hypothetical protein